MYIKYVANDGREFDSESQCQRYERNLQFTTFMSSISKSRFFDVYGNCMEVEEFYRYPWRCDFMEVANREEAEIIHIFLRGVSCKSPWNDDNQPKAGRYYWDDYDDDNGKWFAFDYMREKIDFVQKVFEGK